LLRARYGIIAERKYVTAIAAHGTVRIDQLALRALHRRLGCLWNSSLDNQFNRKIVQQRIHSVSFSRRSEIAASNRPVSNATRQSQHVIKRLLTHLAILLHNEKVPEKSRSRQINAALEDSTQNFENITAVGQLYSICEVFK
jgi:hypothetical protein